MSEWQPDPNGISQVVELANMAMTPTKYQETLNVRVPSRSVPLSYVASSSSPSAHLLLSSCLVVLTDDCCCLSV